MIAGLPAPTSRLPLYSARSEIRDPEALYPAPFENVPSGEKIVFNYFSPSDLQDKSSSSILSCFVRPPSENTPDEGIFLEIKILRQWINEPNMSPEHQRNVIKVLNAINQVILEIQYSFNLNGSINRQVIESLNRLLEDELEVAQVQYHDVAIVLEVDKITDAILLYAQHQRHLIPIEAKNKINYFSIINTTASIESLLRYFEAPSPEIAQEIKTLSTSDLHYYKLNYNDLKSRDLSKAVLNWAYLFNEDLSKIILNGAILNHSLLSGSNFEDAQCNGTSFVETTAHNTLFIKTSLIKADFTGADIGGSNFTGAKLQGIIFTNTILTGIYSEDASLIECFVENNTLGENQYDVLLAIIRYIEGKQDYDVNDQDIQNILFGPLYRNIQNNNTKPHVLSKIITIGNLVLRSRCLNLFFDSLLCKGLNVSLKEIFSQPNQNFTVFSKHYVEYLINHRFNFTLDQARGHLTDLNELNLIRPYLRKYIDARITLENNNNELSETVVRALDWVHTLDGIVPHRIHILASFLAPLINSEDTSYLFVEEEAPYLDQEDGRERKIFISKDRMHLFYLSHDFFQALITEQEPPIWGNGSDRIYFVFDNSNARFEYRAATDIEQMSDAEVFSHVPFLHERYSARRIQRGLVGLLQSMDLGEYREHFLQAVNNRNFYRVPLVSSTHQNNLSSIFNPYMENSHVNQRFITILERDLLYNQMNNVDKSQLLSVLSFIFTRLSSDAFFGVSGDTPITLRLFSIALLNTALRLNPILQITHSGVNWKTHLLGDNCTEQVSRNYMLPVVRNYEIYRNLSPWGV